MSSGKMKELRFSLEAMQAAVNYLTSSIRSEVVLWLLDLFREEFTAQNRGAYEEDIEVQLSFTVHMNSVTCLQTVYSFTEKHYENLPTRLEIAALARALGAGMKVSIMNKYQVNFDRVKLTITDFQGLSEEAHTTVTVAYGNFAPLEW